MNMSRTIAGWCMILFFLYFGLAAFVPALGGGFFPMLFGLLALGVAVFTFLGKKADLHSRPWPPEWETVSLCACNAQ